MEQQNQPRTPTDFLNSVIGRRVLVKLNSGVDYKGESRVFWLYTICPPLFHFLRICQHNVGVLACLDGYMNIALEQTEEYVNGQLKNTYGDAFIRGNNVLYISAEKSPVV
ncbi:U6 snRNA-associated Sm-like protein LSm6 [Endogone sp. FLAS-F59071]|nr:U6 snRNA-associated Sm-like protein LSm6 [Endogone sp. FLAS-F59071]|eukprot:RUS15919.1 U6 snRNA-associated Sm-like protein LSm6 [Endogone sp. FLAS-F59071]